MKGVDKGAATPKVKDFTASDGRAIISSPLTDVGLPAIIPSFFIRETGLAVLRHTAAQSAHRIVCKPALIDECGVARPIGTISL
jgi:hypothetical protein